MPTFVWQGKVFAAAAVVKRPQDTLILECKLGVQAATWPVGLEQGWGQQLVREFCCFLFNGMKVTKIRNRHQTCS